MSEESRANFFAEVIGNAMNHLRNAVRLQDQYGMSTSPGPESYKAMAQLEASLAQAEAVLAVAVALGPDDGDEGEPQRGAMTLEAYQAEPDR